MRKHTELREHRRQLLSVLTHRCNDAQTDAVWASVRAALNERRMLLVARCRLVQVLHKRGQWLCAAPRVTCTRTAALFAAVG